MSAPYRTLFVGALVQESFLSAGGSDDPFTTVDSPFCRDGLGRPTLRGSGLAGALIATLRRARGTVPDSIAGSEKGRRPSAWRCFNTHPVAAAAPAYRQHVAIDERTGAAAPGALFNVETLPPGTRWPFLLEVDDTRDETAAELAREALSHWTAGRCLIGRDVARGLGWMRLEGLTQYALTTEHLDLWPDARRSANYPAYLKELAVTPKPAPAAAAGLPGWLELSGTIRVGERADGYGIDSLSIGGHASEELAAAWDSRFLAPDGMTPEAAKSAFDPDFAVVTWERDDKRQPYIPGSSLRGPLRHALARRLRARGESTGVVDALFGPRNCERSAKLLICDAFADAGAELKLAWMQHHAEDEFTGGAYGPAKFDRVAVMAGVFRWRMVLEEATQEERLALKEVLELARAGWIGIGGGQWRGHGWLHWDINDWETLEACHG